MNTPKCAKCGHPAAFQDSVAEPYICLSCCNENKATISTPTNNDGWTSEPPTVAGVYEWDAKNGDAAEVVWVAETGVVYFVGNTLIQYAPTLGGLWRRLVPAVEVERAWFEGYQTGNAAGSELGDWDYSRAKKVTEGEA